MADIFDSTFDDQYGQMRYWLNLSNAAGEQVELVAKQRDSQNPALVRDADNRDLHPDTNGRVAPNLRDTINRDPGTAAYFKDELPKWDAAARKLFGMGADEIVFDEAERLNKFYHGDIKHGDPIYPHYVKRDFESGKNITAPFRKYGPNVAPQFAEAVRNAYMDIEKARVAETTDKLTRTNGIMRALDMTVPGWRKGSDDQIREDLAHASDVLGIKTDDITPDEIRETKGVDIGNAFDLFGWQEIAGMVGDIYDEFHGPSREEILAANANSPLDLQLRKLRMLEDEREALKESTFGERVVNGVLSSLPFVAEFGLASASGFVTIAGRSPALMMKILMHGMGPKMLLKQPLKFLGKAAQAAGVAAVGAAQRIPLYAMKNYAQAVEDVAYGAPVTMPIGDGKLSIELPEATTSAVFQQFFSNMVQQYIENFSEDLGALIPLGDLDAKAIASWFPKETRNAVVQKLAWTPSTRRFMNRVVMDNVPFNGAWGEFAEEEVGNMLSYFATALLETIGFDKDNTPGTKTLLMGGQETLDTLATIVLQSAGFRTAAAVSNNLRGRGAIGLIENANRVKEQGQKMDEVSDMIADTRLVGASIPQAKQAVGNLRGGDAILHIDAEDAGNVLYQAVEADDKETLGALQELGITKESVDRAQKKGDDLLVSQNLLFVLGTNKHFKTGRDVMHKLWDLSAQSVFGANVKDLTGSSFEKAQLERLTEQAEEDRKFMGEIRSIVFSSLKTAAKNAHDAGAEISNETAQNWVSIISAIQNYIVGNTTEEGREEVKKMLTNLSIQFSENPATFDPKAARAQMFDRAIADAAKQEIGSGETSLDQVAAGFKKIDFMPGTVNLDLGGGKFDKGTEYLAGKGVTNLVYDPVNRSAESNRAIFDAVKNGGVDTVTCNNVLNVIKEEGARSNVILQAAKALKPGGVAYFTVYEGDGSGNGHETSKGWQEHRKTADYMDEIKQHFGDVVRHGKIIEARNPQTEGKTSAWFNEGFGNAPVLFQAQKAKLDEAIANEKDLDVKQAFPQNPGSEVEYELNSLRGKDMVNRDSSIPAQVNRNQATKLVSDTAIKKTVENGFTKNDHMSAVANIEALYENAVLLQERGDLKNGEPEIIIRRFVAPFVIRGEVVDAILTQKESLDKKSSARVYSLELDELISSEKLSGDTRIDRSSQSRIPPLTRENSLPDGWNKLQQKHEKVKQFLEKNGGNIFNQSIQGQIDTTKFAESREAIITLFQKADASTLPHESAHWLKTMMESLIGGGFATPKMEEDLAAINQWLDKQDYSEEIAKKYGLLDKDGKVMMGAMREEFFARAFEAYIRDGKFPVGAEKGLKAALYRLGRLLRSIYLDAAGLNVQMDDSIRAFFNGLFAADYAVKEQSVLSDILRSINEGALAMSKAELADLEKAVAGVRDDAQMQAYLNALREYRDGERAMKPVWRKDAKEAYAASKAERAFTYVKGGHKLDENFLRNVLKLDERDIEILKAKRLVAKSTSVEATPEAAPAEVPAPAPAAPAGPATELTGDAEQFKSLPNNAVISLPADEAKAGEVLSRLTHGETGRGGVLWESYKSVRDSKVPVEDQLRMGWEALMDRFSDGTPVTKLDALNVFATGAKNEYFTQKREDLKQKKSTVSTNDSVTGKDGDTVELGDILGGSQVMDYFWEDLKARKLILNLVPKWVASFEDGPSKMVAEIIYDYLKDGQSISGTELYGEYRDRGGTLSKSRIDDILTGVKSSLKSAIKAYFKERGIHVRFQTATSNAPASIMDTMKELGYDDALRLIGDLKLAVGQKRFIEEYMARRAEEYKNDFINNSPLWQTETGVADYLDAILKALKLTEGMKFSQRVRMEEGVAERELRGRTVREVMGSLRSLEMSLRTSAARVLKAVKNNKEDKAAATTAALSMHRHAAQLNAARKLQAAVRKSMRSAERMGNAKRGESIDGDFLNAILAVRNYFGMSRRKPAWTTGENDPQTVGGVIRKYLKYIVEVELGEVDTTSSRHEALYNAAYQAEKERWSPWLWSLIHGEGPSGMDFRDLTMDQFDEVMNFLDFIDGAGRDIRGEEKAAFGARVRDAVESIVQTTTAHNGKRTGQKFGDQKFSEKLRALAQSGMNWEKTLVSLCDMLDEYSEHYGEKLLGPWRRKFQMVLSAGASRQLHWQQKISKDIKPHLRALMESAKKRKLYAPVKNKMVGGYTELHGDQVAFVLLNAGCVENRERLMSGFGWSEEELNDILKQFTAEDFKHAEAIWASLKEMGEQVAGVFYRDRHYRMPRSESVPIEFTNNDGEAIFSTGGYYPIDYKVKQSTVGAEIKMDPETIMASPLPPSSTYERQTHVDGHLLLDPNVLTRHVHDNARYIGMWEPLRFANAVWTNQAVKDAVLLNYGPETYDTLRKLMQHVNVPENREATSLLQRWGASILPTAALAYKLGPVLSQLQSITVGAERLGRYFWSSFFEFHANPIKMRRRVAELSPFMRDRYNQRERDLKDIGTEFSNGFIRAVDWYRRVGFLGLKLLDLHVAGIQWWAAYNQALNNKANNLTPHEAAIFADDFVASTQGAARTMDVPAVQLNAFMRTLTPFFGPAVAAFNSRMAVLSSLKKMDVGEAVEAVIMTILVPAILAGVKGGLLQGPSSGDDDDDWGRVQRGFVRGLLSDVTSGIPIVQDISDAVVLAAQTNSKSLRNGNIFEASTLRPANDAAKEAFDLATHLDNPEYAAYVGTSLISEALGVPFVDAYENWEKFTLRHFGDSDSKTLKQTLKGGKTK